MRMMTGFRYFVANDEFENFLLEGEEEEYDDDDYNWGNDTARDCIGWEDDMIKNGEFFLV